MKKGFELRDLPHYFAPAGTPEINCCRLLIVVCACLPGYYFYLTLKHVYRDNLHALIKLRPFLSSSFDDIELALRQQFRSRT